MHGSAIGVPEELPRRAADLAILCEIGEVINSSLELDEILNMILIGMTAGQGLRFNRAFLLLVDEESRSLSGRLAIGPDNAEEASRIWSRLEGERLGLRELLLRYGREAPEAGRTVREICSSLSVPLEETSHILIEALRSGAARVVRDSGAGDRHAAKVAEALGVASFAMVPIQARGVSVGVLLADNAIMGRPIEDRDLDILRLFAGHAGTAIEKARLYATLKREKQLLETAHKELRRNQQAIIGLHRFSDLGEMAARMAHEIRNPLVAIGGFARRMLADTPRDGPQRRYLEIMAAEVSRLESILKEVLDLARPHAQCASPVDINAMVRSTAEVVAPEAESLGIRVTLDLDESIPRVPADESLLRIALLNLVRNGMQAVAGKQAGRGQVTIRTRPVGPVVELAIQDDGPGIEAEIAERIFEPFFTTKPSGSGLGLSIVSQIMKQHH
ncbi:MAG TPA: ATP-binding protein, partial [Candidatus Polarisedimenticolia bacterium]|nr:ATP-binding protein [Candidatus Polarisedimenticolia bacterium]